MKKKVCTEFLVLLSRCDITNENSMKVSHLLCKLPDIPDNSSRPGYRSHQRSQPERSKRNWITLQELVTTTTRRNLPENHSSSHPTRVPGSQDDSTNAQRRAFEASSIQLLFTIRDHVSHQPLAFVFRVQQDELQQPLYLLPARDQD